MDNDSSHSDVVNLTPPDIGGNVHIVLHPWHGVQKHDIQNLSVHFSNKFKYTKLAIYIFQSIQGIKVI